MSRQVAQVEAGMARLNRQQGFVSAAEIASYNRALGRVDVALDRYRVAHGYGDDALAPGTADPADRGRCRPETAAALVGRGAPDDGALQRLTGSRTVRRLAPGAMATKDYRVERLTLQLDDAGRIIAASCG